MVRSSESFDLASLSMLRFIFMFTVFAAAAIVAVAELAAADLLSSLIQSLDVASCSKAGSLCLLIKFLVNLSICNNLKFKDRFKRPDFQTHSDLPASRNGRAFQAGWIF